MIKSSLITLLLVFYSCSVLAGGYKEEFASQDKSCRILYEGPSDHGNGIFYDISNGKKKMILREYVRVGPQVNWQSNSLAELFFSEGYPSYHSEYYDCKSQKISPSYSLVIAVEPKSKLIAVLDDEQITFFKLFSDKAFYKAKAPGVGLMRYFDCDSDANFVEGAVLHVKMKCDDGNNVNVKIKTP